MSLQEKLAAIKADFESKAPPEALAIMKRATQALIDGRKAESALRAGQVTAPFTLLDTDGKSHSLSSLLSSGPLVLTFYRGIWCPFCNADLEALEAARATLESRGARLVAISPQNAVNSRKTIEKLSLGFPLLIDAGGEVAQSFGLRWSLPADLKALYTQFGVDLPVFNDDPSWSLPMPARYVIDRLGMIVYNEINPDYTLRPDPDVLFPVLDSIR